MKNEIKIIHYGFGRDYLTKWSIKQALREIYQNFLDFGEYSEVINKVKNTNLVNVKVTNEYKPESLEFLRIGKSDKGNNKDAIGKHGEGLKMAFLILLREYNLNSKIYTDKYIIYPSFYRSKEIGKCFCFKYKKHNIKNQKFTIEFECVDHEFSTFKEGIITKEDYIFTDNYHGNIVDRPKGNIYVGNLFVCNLKNFSKSYNFPPSRIPLDRDREVPRTFDVNYHASKINESYDKWNLADTNYNDTIYISRFPERLLNEVKPKSIEGNIEYINIKTKEVIKNSAIKEAINNTGFFNSWIKKLKSKIIKHLGLYELLIEFQQKYINDYDIQMKQDFELILEKVK